MITGRYNLSIQQRETVKRQFKLMAANSLPFDLTDYTISSQVRANPDSSTVAASFTGSSPDPTNGVVQIEMPASTSALLTASCYFYDLRIISGTQVYYPLEGKLLVSPSITR